MLATIFFRHQNKNLNNPDCLLGVSICRNFFVQFYSTILLMFTQLITLPIGRTVRTLPKRITKILRGGFRRTGELLIATVAMNYVKLVSFIPF